MKQKDQELSLAKEMLQSTEKQRRMREKEVYRLKKKVQGYLKSGSPKRRVTRRRRQRSRDQVSPRETGNFGVNDQTFKPDPDRARLLKPMRSEITNHLKEVNSHSYMNMRKGSMAPAVPRNQSLLERTPQEGK